MCRESVPLSTTVRWIVCVYGRRGKTHTRRSTENKTNFWSKLTISFSTWLSFSFCWKFFLALSTFCSSFRWSPLHVFIFDNFLLCSFKCKCCCWWDFFVASIGTCEDIGLSTADVWIDDVGLINDGFRKTNSSMLSQWAVMLPLFAVERLWMLWTSSFDELLSLSMLFWLLLYF